MLNDIVNKLTFDFTCHSEQDAKTMQNDILNYKLNQFSTILSEVLATNVDKDLLWKIDKLEIDLGNIYLENFGNDEIAQKFKSLLTENIQKNLHRESDINPSIVATNKASIDIIMELLLNGDLPWWIDKNEFSGLDITMRAAFNLNKEELRIFLDTQKNNPDVKRRIKMFCSPETISLLNKIVPGIKDFDPFASAGKKPDIEKLSSPKLTTFSFIQSLKLLLIHRLLKIPGNFILQGIKILKTLTANEITELELYFSLEVPKISNEKAIQTLQQLTIYQLEFLLLSEFLINPVENYPISNLIADPEIEKTSGTNKVISYVISNLKTKNPELLIKLNNASEQSLRHLQHSFKQYKNSKAAKKMMISLLLEHPDFIKIFTQTINSKVSAKRKLLKIIKNLTEKQSELFNEVLFTGEFTSASSRKTISRVLNSMSFNDLKLISQIIFTSNKEVESFIPASTGLKKTIIENAGLSILAPFLPAFFNRLGFTENGKFKTKTLAFRAIYLLQYIVNSRQRNYEYDLQLNKLLCGFNIHEPITVFKRLSRLEKIEAEDLIASAINHWKALKSTSKKGFQLSFLQRKGILTENEDFWTLQVEKSSYDLLLDGIPWAFNLIKLPWMNKMIQVEW